MALMLTSDELSYLFWLHTCVDMAIASGIEDIIPIKDVQVSTWVLNVSIMYWQIQIEIEISLWA